MIKVRDSGDLRKITQDQSNGIKVQIEECPHPAKKPNLAFEKESSLDSKNNNNEMSVTSESDTEALGHQIAGHDRIGILKHKLGYVLKPIQKEPLGSRELNFYKKVFGLVDQEIPATIENGQAKKKEHLLQSLIPKFHGTTKIQCFKEKVPTWKEYLMFDDIIEGFTHPCVIDIKMGSQTWDPDATAAKIEHEKSKYKGTKEPLGLSVTGMLHFDLKTQKTIKMKKEFGKNLVESSLIDTIKEFSNRAYNESSPQIISKKLLERLNVVLEYFKVQREFRFYSSSLLIAYDAKKLYDLVNSNKNQGASCNGKSNDSKSDSDSKDEENWLRVWMIDFAHVFPAETDKPDENYLFGLNNLIRILKNIAK